MNRLQEEIEFRQKNDLWDKQISKKIKRKVMVKTFIPLMKILILFFVLSISIVWWYIQEMNKEQLFVNLLFEYQSHNFFDYVLIDE
ncbi:MAG: hypothetical protein ACK4UJ_05140 [Leptonema sp. (in: bacteria)]